MQAARGYRLGGGEGDLEVGTCGVIKKLCWQSEFGGDP